MTEDKKYDELSKKIADAKGEEKTEPTDAERRANSLGLRIASEIIAATLVGMGIGYLLDEAFDTKPWLLLVFLMLGMITAFYNINKILNKKDDDNS